MRRVELIGPPGVGKTTLLRKLQQELGKTGVAVTSPHWLPLWTYHDRNSISGYRRRFENRLYRAKGIQRWMRPKLEKELVRHEFRKLRDAEPAVIEFLQFGLGLGQGEEAAASPALTLERMQSFMRSVALARAADRLPGDTVVLFDEGIGQRGVSLGQGVPEGEVRRYFRLMPAPGAVILVTAPTELIQERLRLRNPDVTRFHAMVEHAQHICSLAGDACEERGVPVLTVDVSGAAAESARGLADALPKAWAG